MVIIHHGSQAGTCCHNYGGSMHNTYSAKNDMTFVSRVIISGITLRPHVDQFAIGTPSLADSLLMIQFCRHYWEAKNLQQCAWLLATHSISYPAGQHTVQLRLHRITCAADVTQYARKRDLLSQSYSGRNTLLLSKVYERTRPKFEVFEGFMALVDDKRPEWNLLIELSQYALQHCNDMS